MFLCNIISLSGLKSLFLFKLQLPSLNEIKTQSTLSGDMEVESQPKRLFQGTTSILSSDVSDLRSWWETHLHSTATLLLSKSISLVSVFILLTCFCAFSEIWLMQQSKWLLLCSGSAGSDGLSNSSQDLIHTNASQLFNAWLKKRALLNFVCCRCSVTVYTLKKKSAYVAATQSKGCPPTC